MGRYSSDSSSESDIRKSSKSSRSRRHRSRSSSYGKSSHSSRSSTRKRRGRSRSKSQSSSPKSSYKSRHSRSRSPESSRARDLSRSREKSSRVKGRSRSRDRDSKRDKDSKSRSKYKDRSRSRERSKTKNDLSKLDNSIMQAQSAEERLHNQLKKALEAAANADAQLREQGVLSNAANTTRAKLEKLELESKPSTSFSDQMRRAQAIDDVNSSGFTQQAFMSNRSTNSKQNRQSSPLGFGTEADIKEEPVEPEDEEFFIPPKKSDGIAHENLQANPKLRQEKWIRKLMALRQRKINVYHNEQKLL